MVRRVVRSILAVFLLMSIATAAGAQGTFEANTNRPGADIARFPVGPNPLDCQKACAAETRCMSWSYNQRAMMCWLKGKVQPARVTPGTISGVVRGAPPAPAPQAQFERFCREYADHAVDAANRAGRAGCAPHRAFRNDFVADRALHYNWCLRSSEQVVAAGRQSRQQALDSCLAAAKPQAQFDSFCRDYANHAVNVARRAKASLCPSNGWYSENFSGHYNWCKNAPEQAVVAHRQSRQKALDACLRGSP